MLQTIFLCCSSSSGHWRVLQTYYQCMDVNAKISQNSHFKYIYFSTSHTIQFITVNRYLKVWEILLGTEHVIITLWQMSETIPGFVCLFVLLLLLNSTSFVFTDDFSAVILSKIECILTDEVLQSLHEHWGQWLHSSAAPSSALNCTQVCPTEMNQELDICIWTYT